MTKREREMLSEVYRMSVETNGIVCYFKKEMQVNGAIGLENILLEHDKELKALKPRIEEMWLITARQRAWRALSKAFGRLMHAMPFLSKPLGWLWEKILSKLFWTILLGVLSLIGLDAMRHAIQTIINFLK